MSLFIAEANAQAAGAEPAGGDLFQVSVNNESITVESLFNVDMENKGWRIGGMQSIAYHSENDLLLTLMHEGGEHTHKDPGTEIWVFDLSAKRLLHKMKLENMATAIAISQDVNPLVYSTFIGGSSLDIYGAIDRVKGGSELKHSSISHFF